MCIYSLFFFFLSVNCSIYIKSETLQTAITPVWIKKYTDEGYTVLLDQFNLLATTVSRG